jgi:hypothetical protein
VALKRQKSNQNQIIKGLKEKKNPQISVLLQECVCFLNCPQMPILDDTWTLSHINMLSNLMTVVNSVLKFMINGMTSILKS